MVEISLNNFMYTICKGEKIVCFYLLIMETTFESNYRIFEISVLQLDKVELRMNFLIIEPIFVKILVLYYPTD